MAPHPNKEGTQLRSDFDKVCETLYDLSELDECDMDFDNGWIVSETDIAMMRISYDDLAGQAFWKPYAKDAKIEAALEDHEEMVIDIEHEIERGTTRTVADAYLLSMDYSDFLWFCIWRAAFHNPIFVGTDGSSRFEQIRGDKIWDDLHVETRLMFGTPGYPHITVLSIQPQQASTKELMYTEFWTLYYWAARLCGRVRYNPDKTLPIRLVSLCDRRARVVSAVFSSGYIRCLATRSGDPKGEDVSCRVQIGDYYDFRESVSCLLFANEMIAQPIGTETVLKEDLRAERRGRVSRVVLPQ